MNYQTVSFDTDSTAQTEQLAKQLGSCLRGGECIELVSDLGGGKTAFVRGLALGAGSTDIVSSPTFTISKVYKTQLFAMHHFDFYRISEPGHIQYELEDLIADSEVVIVIEWAKIVSGVLPQNKICIEIEKTSSESRRLTITYPQDRAYLLETIC